jgi:hypothetical protein
MITTASFICAQIPDLLRKAIPGNERFHCGFPLRGSADPALLDQWMANWNDLVEFEVFPVLPSNEAAAKILNSSVEELL